MYVTLFFHINKANNVSRIISLSCVLSNLLYGSMIFTFPRKKKKQLHGLYSIKKITCLYNSHNRHLYV